MTVEPCPRCHGRGEVPTSASTLYPDWMPCWECRGRGVLHYVDGDEWLRRQTEEA